MVGTVMEEKAASMTNEEFFLFVSEVNRAMEIAHKNIDNYNGEITNLANEL